MVDLASSAKHLLKSNYRWLLDLLAKADQVTFYSVAQPTIGSVFDWEYF